MTTNPSDKLIETVEEGLAELPVIDPHTHLIGGSMGARGLHDVLLYHYIISGLYAAGCPNGNRLSQYPARPTDEEARQRIEEALPYLPLIRNTSIYWGLKMVLRDLYGWKEPITRDNWQRLDAIIREEAADPASPHRILDGLNIKRSVTEFARREGGKDDARLQYSLEWGFFTRCQWGEYDTALYELERCWGRPPESPSPIGAGGRPKPDRTIHTLADVEAAMKHYVDSFPYDYIVSTATHLSTDINYRMVTDAEMETALKNRPQAREEERDIYASYIQEAYLEALEKSPRKVAYQFSFGAEPLPYETGSRLAQRTIGQLAEMIGKHPGLHFQCYLSSRHANQSICTLARELPNLSVVGDWWHNFYPDVMRQVLAERLEMLPLNKQIGFFSDAPCVEWTYGKTRIARRIMAGVLAEKIGMGQYTLDEALDIAGTILFDTPRDLLGITPRQANLN